MVSFKKKVIAIITAFHMLGSVANAQGNQDVVLQVEQNLSTLSGMVADFERHPSHEGEQNIDARISNIRSQLFNGAMTNRVNLFETLFYYFLSFFCKAVYLIYKCINFFVNLYNIFFDFLSVAS